jgi:hypothetical protein
LHYGIDSTTTTTLDRKDEKPTVTPPPLMVQVLEEIFEAKLRHTPPPANLPGPDAHAAEIAQAEQQAQPPHALAQAPAQAVQLSANKAVAAPVEGVQASAVKTAAEEAVRRRQQGGEAVGGSSAGQGGDVKYPLPQGNSGTAVKALKLDSERYAKLTSPLDELSLTVSAWIYLDQSKATNTINTVLGNKASGCEVTPDRMGYALYVNTWETVDRQLILEWGNDRSGCAKLGSGQSGVVIEYNTWTHVAAVLTSASASIYINGREVRAITDVT